MLTLMKARTVVIDDDGSTISSIPKKARVSEKHEIEFEVL